MDRIFRVAPAGNPFRANRQELPARAAFPAPPDIAHAFALPIPFSLKKLWYELIDPEIKTWKDQQRTQSAKISDGETRGPPKTLRSHAPCHARPRGLTAAPFGPPPSDSSGASRHRHHSLPCSRDRG